MSNALRAVVPAVLFFIVIALIAVAAIVVSSRQLSEEEQAALARQDELAKAHIVDSIERIRKALGRVPMDREELEQLMGEPIPKVHDNGVEIPIFYHRLNDNHFLLQYELWATDDWVFNSEKPNDGWVQRYF